MSGVGLCSKVGHPTRKEQQMGWLVLGVIVLAVLGGVGWAAVQVWAQLSLIRSNSSLAKSYSKRAERLRNR